MRFHTTTTMAKEVGGRRRRRGRKSIDEVTMGNWTRRGVVVVDEITRQIDALAIDRFFCRSRAKYMTCDWRPSALINAKNTAANLDINRPTILYFSLNLFQSKLLQIDLQTISVLAVPNATTHPSSAREFESFCWWNIYFYFYWNNLHCRTIFHIQQQEGFKFSCVSHSHVEAHYAIDRVTTSLVGSSLVTFVNCC